MPNLNLKGGTPAPMVGVKPSGKPAPAGFGSRKVAGLPMPVVLLLGAVIVLGGGYFGLNKMGIIGKKKPVPVVVAPPATVPEDTTSAASTAARSENEGLVEFKEKPSFGSEKKADVKSSMKPSTTMTPGKTAKSTASTFTSSTLPKIPMSSSGKYSVQVSSWSSEQKAKIEADVLTRAGFPAFVEKGNVSGEGKRFRVYVGRYDSDKAARSSAEKIAHMLEGGYWVVRLSK
jgi:cell division septation protein DedD